MSLPELDISELLTQMAKALATRETARAWVATLTAEDLARAWASCPDGRALLRLAAPVVDPKVLVRVACACLRFALDQKKGHHRVRNAVKVLEQWTHGVATWSDVERAGTKATDSGNDLSDIASALLAAASIPEDPSRAQDVVAELSLALSNEGEVYAAGLPAPARKTRVAALAQLADVVRASLPCPSREALAHSKSSMPS
jgi:hypothetical protein